MLWKPYKKSGLSKCFQPNWNGPWEIERFTNQSRSNCTIRCCTNRKNYMNVHVSQLKPVGYRNAVNAEKSVVEKVVPKVSFTKPEIHDHYLEDFDDDEVAGNDLVDNHVVEANVERDELIEPADVVNGGNAGVHIDNAWVDLDVPNIVPRRTRGVRQDYQELASGSD